MQLDVMKTIKKWKKAGKINKRYDIKTRDVSAIAHSYSITELAIWDAFVFGYAQGSKATKAEMKRKAKAVQG